MKHAATNLVGGQPSPEGPRASPPPEKRKAPTPASDERAMRAAARLAAKPIGQQ